MTTNRAASGVGARLRADLEQAGMSRIGLARALAGPDATHKEIEDWRRYVTRWTGSNGHGMSTDNAKAVARILGSDPERYRTDRFSRREKLERELQRSLDRTRQLRDELAQLQEP